MLADVPAPSSRLAPPAAAGGARNGAGVSPTTSGPEAPADDELKSAIRAGRGVAGSAVVDALFEALGAGVNGMAEAVLVEDLKRRMTTNEKEMGACQQSDSSLKSLSSFGKWTRGSTGRLDQ